MSEDVKKIMDRIRTEVAKVVVGQQEAVTLLQVGLLAGGHVLLEGVPGLAKTLLAKAAAGYTDAAFVAASGSEFIEMYEGQYLFHDMSKFLYDNGYELLYLNRFFHNRSNYNGEARGQIIWGDALFGRREDKLDGFSDDQIAKYVILLINYGHLDFAHYLIQKYKHIENLIPKAKLYFKFYKKSFFNYLKRVIYFQYDKILYLLIHLRKTNKNNYDHDRNWPIR